MPGYWATTGSIHISLFVMELSTLKIVNYIASKPATAPIRRNIPATISGYKIQGFLWGPFGRQETLLGV
jgi:hypothetical protein